MFLVCHVKSSLGYVSWEERHLAPNCQIVMEGQLDWIAQAKDEGHPFLHGLDYGPVP